MKQGAIFDMDGLLFDTERIFRDSWTETAKRFGQIPQPDLPAAIAGTSGAGMREVILRYYPGTDPFAFQESCISHAADILKKGVPEKPGVREILESFRSKHIRSAVASSSSRKMIMNDLRSTGIDGYFDVIVSGEDVSRGKPAPDIFLLAAQRLGCAPQDCYVFEDGINGVRAGIAAGCVTIMIPDLFEPTEDIRAGCAGIFPDLQAAQRAIESNIL